MTTHSLQAVMNQSLEAYRPQHPLTPRQYQICHHLLDCRTPALGGLQLACDRCETEMACYHSCRDRHCPCCGGKG